MRVSDLKSSKDYLPAIPANIRAAQEFAFRKWCERAAENGREPPMDLTSACKFSSMFAVAVFGGKIKGNFFHQWAELSDGQRVDLNDKAADTLMMQQGLIPDDVAAYAESFGMKLPKNLYAHDASHMRHPDTRDSASSIRPRIERWRKEFMEAMGAAH